MWYSWLSLRDPFLYSVFKDPSSVWGLIVFQVHCVFNSCARRAASDDAKKTGTTFLYSYQQKGFYKGTTLCIFYSRPLKSRGRCPSKGQGLNFWWFEASLSSDYHSHHHDFVKSNSTITLPVGFYFTRSPRHHYITSWWGIRLSTLASELRELIVSRSEQENQT